jgi:patatin-like phospholipase/acyl hydrolase
MVLIEIEERTGKSITELFPIISGTSVGGLIAALLTIPGRASVLQFRVNSL